MKTRHYLLCTLIAIAFSTKAKSQTIAAKGYVTTWNTVEIPFSGFSFKMPYIPIVVDSTRVKFYFCTVDSLLSFQANYISNVAIDTTSSNAILKAALLQTSNDTLRAIAKIMVLSSNSDVLSIENKIINGNVTALEIGLKHRQDHPLGTLITLTQLMRVNNTFITFTATGYQHDMVRFISNKDLFFNSIQYAQP